MVFEGPQTFFQEHKMEKNLFLLVVFWGLIVGVVGQLILTLGSCLRRLQQEVVKIRSESEWKSQLLIWDAILGPW